MFRGAGQCAAFEVNFFPVSNFSLSGEGGLCRGGSVFSTVVGVEDSVACGGDFIFSGLCARNSFCGLLHKEALNNSI